MTLERGTLLHNRYRIVEILGQGGMGSVYRAVDENLGVDCAVKENLFTTDEYARQFRLEAVILANLRHQNLPRVTDHFVIDDQGQYLVMDYIEGEDLRQRMERVGTLSDDEVILIGAAMCDALEYLHSRKPPILHRDVKPGNVKITSEGEVFLVDFGLAKVIQGGQVTTTGARAMTPGYSPPEQYGTARTDARTDIYSLGATLYAALTGIIPEDGLARAMENTELTPVRKRASNVSRRLAAAIEKSMSVDSDDRFQAAKEFRKALLASNSKTQRLKGDFTVSPSPSVPLGQVVANANEEPAREDVPLAAQEKIPSQPSLPQETPRQKRRKSRGKFIRFLMLLILLIGGITGGALYYPEISDTVSNTVTDLVSLLSPTAIQVSTATQSPSVMATATENIVMVEETATATATPTVTNTLVPTATLTLTPPPSDTPTPTLTPVGGGAGQIAFASDRTGAPQIYLSNVDGSGTRPITNLSEGACQPDWSPDGLQLVFVSPCETGKDVLQGSSLFVVDIDGMNLTQLSTVPGGDFEPAWSPDGKRIAFTSLRDGYMQIYSINLEDNSVQRLTDTNKDEFARQPAWSPFGNQIAYSIRRYSAYQIWTMTDTGQSHEQLTRSGYAFWDILPVWAPDGTVILYNQRFSDNPNPARVWLMSIRYENRGSEGVDVEAEPLPVIDFDYSSDGFWLAFEGYDGDNQDIYFMTVAGSTRTRLTTDPAHDFDPAWRPVVP
ncbi:MAG: hypothetical protein B5M51_00545 [Anaerolinea sp. 4484_236]|nr:MAG: hypothetical protein B5M51_00545 [Anaerolinea sp. 4484_236]